MAKPPPSRSSTGSRPIPAPPPSSAKRPDPASDTKRAAPLIVTAILGAADFSWAQTLRRQHYPPERNQVAAHLTLFRHLPPSIERELKSLLAQIACGPKPAARATGPISLGHGVAIAVESPALIEIRETMADRFVAMLTPQDRATIRLHVTIQNKVTREVALATMRELAQAPVSRPLIVKGLALWRYLDGPWAPVGNYSFRG